MPTQSASLYEQLFPLTTVMKQRVVDNFSGDTINDRWNTFVQTSSFTVSMVDSVNGGVQGVTGTGTNHGGGINFNAKRQYAHNGSVVIWVSKVDNSTNIHQIVMGGLNWSVGNADNAGLDSATWGSSHLTNANFYNRTINTAGSQTDTASSIARDTDWHVFKQVLGASDVEGFIDGISETTSTTTLPQRALNPIWGAQNGSSASAVTVSARYMEAYNT